MVELGYHILLDQAQMGSHCLGHLKERAGQSWAGLSLGLASASRGPALLLSWDPLRGTAWGVSLRLPTAQEGGHRLS